MYNKFNQKTQLSIKLGSHFLTTPPQKKKKKTNQILFSSNLGCPTTRTHFLHLVSRNVMFKAKRAPRLPPEKKKRHDKIPWNESSNFIVSATVNIYMCVCVVPECLQ